MGGKPVPNVGWVFVNRAPVLTLWAAVVARRLGFDRDEALTMGRVVAGLNAYAAPLGPLEAGAETKKKYGLRKLDYLFGTMIEIPRACLVADKMAGLAEFFSFGTNDLTQMGLGFSRDDIGAFVPDYIKRGILSADPFATLDQEGVGQLIEMGIERGRSVRPKLKVGICGEHGGDPESVKFCHRVGMDYVSCSPYRVPIARLASAQAVVEEKTAKPAATTHSSRSQSSASCASGPR